MFTLHKLFTVYLLFDQLPLIIIKFTQMAVQIHFMNKCFLTQIQTVDLLFDHLPLLPG